MTPYSSLKSSSSANPDALAPRGAGASAGSRQLRGTLALGSWVCAAALGLATASAWAFPNYPISPEQRATAQKVAQAGVPLSALRDNAPDSYKVKRGDTLWGISGVFLKRPYRWPELWGMNMDQIHNPHLIFPGQILYLDKSNGRARLRMGEPVQGSSGEEKLSPRIRNASIEDAIASVPLSLIEPFMNEAVVFNNKEDLEAAPRIVAGTENRVLLGRGDKAYVRGDVGAAREWRIFRAPKALKDPTTHEILGYEAAYVGAADLLRVGDDNTVVDGKSEIVPSTIEITSIRQEAGVGDRLNPLPQREFLNYAPHRPAQPISGQVVSIYGEALTAGQNQIVALNKGAQDGLERGHVLALIHDGEHVRDTTAGANTTIKLPDEEQGLLFVFRVFDRVSYALILRVEGPVKVGDRFSQPEGE